VVDGETVDTFPAGDMPPGTRRLRRVDAEPHLLSFAWETDARTEGEHTYAVQVSTDNGGTWQTLAVGPVTPEITIDRNQLYGAKSVVVRVTATGGFRSSVVTSEPLPPHTQY
jgi:hypothetical protein